MRNLVIYPSFLCPFACAFCVTKNKSSYNEILSIEKLDKFLNSHQNCFDKIIISGGEPMALKKDYFNQLIDTIKKYNYNITINSYPYNIDNYREDVEYNLSYDFMARARALEVWENLLRFPKKFDITVTISPMIFKYHPNAILQKLSLLPNIKSVEFVPYCKNESSQYDITKNNCLDKFNKMILSSKLNVPYKLVNKEKLRNKILNEKQNLVDICLLPNGELYYQDFDNEILKFIKTDDSILTKNISLIYPDNIDLYSQQLIQWSQENEI